MRQEYGETSLRDLLDHLHQVSSVKVGVVDPCQPNHLTSSPKNHVAVDQGEESRLLQNRSSFPVVVIPEGEENLAAQSTTQGSHLARDRLPFATDQAVLVVASQDRRIIISPFQDRRQTTAHSKVGCTVKITQVENPKSVEPIGQSREMQGPLLEDQVVSLLPRPAGESQHAENSRRRSRNIYDSAQA